MLRVFAILLALASGAAAAPEWNVRTELLIVRVPQERGLRLRPRLRDPRTVEAAVAELRTLIATGSGKLMGAPVIWSPDQSRSVSETIEEIRYPTDFDPISLPQSFAIRQLSPSERIWMHARYAFDVPQAFETRNTGVIVELEPNVSVDGRIISLAIVPQHVVFEGMQKILFTPAHADDWRFRQPLFKTHKVTTTLDVASGAWRMINVCVISGATPAMEFFLLRATALPVSK